MNSLIVAVIVAVFTLACAQKKPSFCGRYDCPFFAKQEFDGYELRTYTNSKWVSTSVSGPRGMFMSLFDYIDGGNAEGKKIPMTVPVTTKQNNDGSETMSFYLKEDSPPSPTNPDLTIETKINAQFYVGEFRKFFVWASDNDFNTARDDLVAAIGDPSQYSSDGYYQVSYTGPMHFGWRHYEVWLEKV